MEAILPASTWKLLWFEITKMLIASFIIPFHTISFPMKVMKQQCDVAVRHGHRNTLLPYWQWSIKERNFNHTALLIN